MEQIAKGFPEIEGLAWLSDELPDLVSIKIVMENRKLAELDIPGLDTELILLDNYLDLSKLAGVKDWYEKGSNDPSTTECLCDFVGIDQIILTIKKEDLLQAWLFNKKWHHENR